jgi:hypothetical protein
VFVENRWWNTHTEDSTRLSFRSGKNSHKYWGMTMPLNTIVVAERLGM